MTLPLLATTIALAAATATPMIDLDLSPYERVDIAFENTGANDVTACTYQPGVATADDSIAGSDATLATTIAAALVVGGKSVTTLTGDDVPSHLTVGLTSTTGTSVKVIVTGVCKDTALFPGT